MSSSSSDSLNSELNASIPSNSNSNPPMRIRYRFGMAPDHIITNDPNLSEVLRGMNKIDGAVFLTTVLIPSIYGYRTQSNLEED